MTNNNAQIASYVYDPLGRRVSKTVENVTTFYHYNAMSLCGEYNASGNLLKSYGYAPGSGWSTDPLFMKVAPSSISDIQSPIFYFFHNDALGTPQALTDKAGTIMWTAQYDEFGSATISGNGGTSSTSSVVCNLRFPGQYFDAETGLHYNFHRYYDPTLGRYITEDPIRDGLNWYAYAGSDPGNAIDPLGLKSGLFDRKKSEPTGQIHQSKLMGPLEVYRVVQPEIPIYRNNSPSALIYFFPEYANNIMNFTGATIVLPFALSLEAMAIFFEVAEELSEFTDDIPLSDIANVVEKCPNLDPYQRQYFAPSNWGNALRIIDMTQQSGTIFSDPYRNSANSMWSIYNRLIQRAYEY